MPGEQSPAVPCFWPRCIARSAVDTPDPSTGRSDPRSTALGELQRALSRAAAGFVAGGSVPPPPPRPFALDRQIRMQRPRLDLGSSHLAPLDPDPSVLNQTYRFALCVLLKRPPTLPKSTRSPILFKNIYAEVLFLAFYPLSFLKIKPAVHPWQFYVSDPGSIV